MRQEGGPLFVSVPEAARILGVGRDRCYDWCRRGIVPAVRDGGRIYVARRGLADLADRVLRGELADMEQPAEGERA